MSMTDFGFQLTPRFAGPAFIAACCLASAVSAQQFLEQQSTRFPQPPPSEYTSQLTVGDIDNDGDLDIIWANGAGFVCPVTPQILRVFINNGSGVFTDETAARTGNLTFRARGVELGDIEGDGDLDIIVANDCNFLPALLVNNGSGVFTDQANTRLPALTMGSSRAQFGDVDNDGDLDLYFTNGGTSRWGSGRGKLYLNNGAGFFSDVTTTNTPNQNTSEPQDIIFGDLDGDFDLDIRIGSTAANQGRLYRNNGAGVFSIMTAPADNNCYSYDFGDFDGDGDLDLIGANAHPSSINGELLLRNNGSGTFTALTAIASGDDNDSKFLDYDGDGDLDLFIAALSPGAERVYANNGTGTFALAPGIVQSISDASLDLKVADVNADGRYDLITAQGESGSFINRIYINMTGPVDVNPPKVVKTEQVVDTQDTKGPYVVRAIIYDDHTSDRGFHDKGVYINYTVGPNPGPAQQVPMRWVGNSLWRGEIPGQPSHSVIEYSVSATDFASNVGSGPDLTFTILPPPCPADTDGSGAVDVVDLLAIINAWGMQSVTHNVIVRDFEFDPVNVSAKSGDTMNWIHESGFHTVTSGSGCAADNVHFNQAVSSGSFQWQIPPTFNGNIPYFCIPHCPVMSASIAVAPFTQDVNQDGVVDVTDLLGIINAWGDCP